ncbi:hypothetical protein [Halorussus aquaticus]|uniref:Uncharacterized protein n=1 Tax=Halorussus aquaticus TaxID=2953748 RepID=A0ABD5Q2Q1_9EURY|nr:hypothetical protein [Halorussus aquaticus]
MVELDCRAESHAGVTLVELVVRNPSTTARRVRVGNRLDGPVWPPRREGVPAAGWDDGGFEGVVAAEDRRALGYATPASAESAVEVEPPTEVERPAEDRPPAELVWTERAGESEGEADSDTFGDDATPEGVVRALGDPRPPADAVPAAESNPERETATPESPIPGAVEAWLSAVEARAEGETDSVVPSQPTPEHVAALAAVARRVERLRARRSRRSP